MSIHETVLAAIGSTPLVRLQKLARPDDAAVLVKLEYLNPGGSIKDRMALHILARGQLLLRRQHGRPRSRPGTGHDVRPPERDRRRAG